MYYGDDLTFSDGSLSARRAWIEISAWGRRGTASEWSLSARRAWIEIPTYRWQRSGIVSLSARRAWIEILPSKQCAEIAKVALRKESVDRNSISRNGPPGRLPVALRKESVDRNYRVGNIPLHIVGSLSARRAWIEIVIAAVFSLTTVLSLSARRAWIEMPCRS